MTNESASGERPGEDVCTDADFTGKQVASGSAWTVASFAVTSVVRLASSLVLTRILPDAASAYGVMSIVFAFYGGLLLFSDVGIPMLLTQNPRGMEPSFRHTAFTASILRGVLIWLVALALAPLCAAAYPDYEGLQGLLSVTALSAVIGGFGSTSLSAFQRRLQVAKIAKVELVSQLTGTCVTMAHALMSPSAWAMVSGAIAAVAIKVVLSHWWNDCPDRIRWDREAARHLKTVGRWVFVSTALTFFATQSERLVLGQVATEAQLGVYAVAATYLVMTTHLIQMICSNVLYPVLCQSDRKAGDFAASFLGHRRQISILGGFLMTCLCGGGEALMNFLYEDDFARGGWMLQISACGVWFGVVLRAPRLQMCLAKGQPKYTAAVNMVMVLCLAAFVPLGAYAFGMTGALWAYVASNICGYLATVYLNRRLGIGAFAEDLRLTAWFGAATALILWGDACLLGLGAGALSRCVGVGVFATICWSPGAIGLIRAFLKARRSGDR